MNNKERAKLRKIQDRFVLLCEKRGFQDNEQVINDMAKTTLGQIRMYLYPQYKGDFEAVLHD